MRPSLIRFLLRLSLFIVILLTKGCHHKPLYDERIKGLLDKNNLVYEIDRDGDFRVSVPLLDSEGSPLDHENVWIISPLKPYDNLEIREVFSLAIALPSQIPASLLESLMADSYNNRFLGSWVILERDRHTRYLAYLAKFSTSDLVHKNLIPILKEVANASYGMREILLASSSLSTEPEPPVPTPLSPEDPSFYPPALDYHPNLSY